MNSFFDIADSRYSVRRYDKSREVEKEKLDVLVKTAGLAPSSCNTQPWRFVVVNDKEKRDLLFKKGLGVIISNKWAESAPVFIVVCADLKFMVHNVAARFQGVDYYLLDMGAAIQTMLLQAADLGLGTCWIGWFKEKNIKKLLNIPRSIKVVSLITAGYPAQDEKKPERKRLETEKILFYNNYAK
ncbi:nitroreductase family protein [bacterium]